MTKISQRTKLLIQRISAVVLSLMFLGFNLPLNVVYAQTYTYTGGIQSVTLQPGSYNIEMWGADGGDGSWTNLPGGKGGYSTGTYNITTPTTIYIVVGGKGVRNTIATGSGGGGYNGGGQGYDLYGVGGGGATHISTASGLLSDVAVRNGIVIVAGGGGATSGWASTASLGGNGGGLSGTNGAAALSTSGTGGTQTAGGTQASTTYGNSNGVAGIGGSGLGNQGCGGGGGWFGGGGGPHASNGGGGSGYVANIPGGATFTFGDVGFVANPNTTGNGYVIITSNSCSGTPDGGTATALVDSVACNQPGTVELSGTVTMPGVSHVWQYSVDRINWVSTSNTTNTYTHPSLNTTTYFRVQVTCANSGLSGYSYMDSIVVNSMPINWNTDTVICAGQSYVLDPNVNGSFYDWNTGASTPTITVNAPGTYSVTVTMPDGCISRGSQNVTSVPYPTGDFSYTQIGFSEYQFVSRVQHTDLVEWEFGDGTPNQTGTTVTHIFSTPGIYIVKMYARNACGVADVSAIGIDVKGTSTQELAVQYGVNIYPNPAVDNKLNISFEKGKLDGKFTILDISGRVLKVADVGQSTSLYTLDISDLKRGQYLLLLNIDGHNIYSKFIKE